MDTHKRVIGALLNRINEPGLSRHSPRVLAEISRNRRGVFINSGIFFGGIPQRCRWLPKVSLQGQNIFFKGWDRGFWGQRGLEKTEYNSRQHASKDPIYIGRRNKLAMTGSTQALRIYLDHPNDDSRRGYLWIGECWR